MLSVMLLEASGAGTGFVGGIGIDSYPHLTLTEATSAFSCDIIDFLSECIDVDSKVSEARMAALIESARYGTAVDAAALVEAGFETFKRKVGEFFTRIKKWIQSIIAKITAFIDTFTKTGRQLAAKYGSEIKSKEGTGAYKDLEFTGYQYVDDIAGRFVYDKFDQIFDVVSDCVDTSKFMDPITFAATVERTSAADLDKNPAIKNAMEGIKDIEGSKVVRSAIETITGETSIGPERSDWKLSLMRVLQGNSTEKEVIRYGSGWFNATKLIDYFSNPADWKAVQAQYKKLQDACNVQERLLSRAVNAGTSDWTKVEGGQQKVDVVTRYLSDFLQLVSWCWDGMTFVTDIKVQAIKSCNMQAKFMISKLVNTGPKKKDEDFELDDSDFDFDFA